MLRLCSDWFHTGLKRTQDCDVAPRMSPGLLAFLILATLGSGCGPNQGEADGDDSISRDAYAAARIMVGKSVASPSTTRISRLDDDLSTGSKETVDGAWRTWGWLELTDSDGAIVHEEWRAVMRQLPGEGRRWHALWLKVGDQQSGDPTAWEPGRR